MISHIPAPILEAVDGTFLILLMFAFGATFSYMIRMTWRDFRSAGRHIRRWSVESKAAWSLSVIFFGLLMRVGTHWSLRHSVGHGLHWGWMAEASPAIILVSTVLTTWGIMCWIRTVIPPRPGVWTWTTVSLAAATFGIYMAM